MASVTYGVVGDGRAARHLAHYFDLLGLSYVQWSRQSERPLEKDLSICDTILILIKDSAIVPFIRKNFAGSSRRLIHFSGSLVTPFALGMHPLMTFGESPYRLEDYRAMPFVCEPGLGFREVFPSLENPHFVIPAELKPFYHSLCVMSGNFTVLLWQKMFREMESRLGIPSEAAKPYLARIAANLAEGSGTALTGPLARRDWETIERNLDALEGDPYQGVYRSFVEAHLQPAGTTQGDRT